MGANLGLGFIRSLTDLVTLQRDSFELKGLATVLKEAREPRLFASHKVYIVESRLVSSRKVDLENFFLLFLLVNCSTFFY